MVPLSPEVVRRFWSLVVAAGAQQLPLEELVDLYRGRYGLNALELVALKAYIHSRLPLIRGLQ